MTSFKTWLAAISMSSVACLSLAQGWPDKPVKFVVPYAPGGTTDFSARMVADRLTQQTGKSFFVENKTGASGTIGTTMVAKSAPDGTTFLINDTTYAMLPSLFSKLPWDHANDLIPVTTLSVTPVVLVVGANSPFKTAKELIDYARSNPGKLNFGSGGTGSSTHLSAEVFKKEGNLFITHIPYKGAGDAMVALLGNQVDLLITAAPTAVPQVQGGKVRALAVTGDKPLPALPGVPTFKDVGLPGYKVTNWFGIAAPKGTPKDIIDRLQSEVAKAMSDAKLVEKFGTMGARPGGIPSAEFGNFVKSEVKMWSDVSKTAGVKPE